MKILAIDDNRDNLTTLQAVVSDRLPGATVLTARNGRAGIELARSEDPDVILLDIVMPGLDGYEVCRTLKADERLQTIPVLFLTALRTDLASRVAAMDAGAEGFLSKPVDEIELVPQIRAMVKIKAANRQRRMEKEELEALVTQRTVQLVQELAERTRVEASLRESEERFQKLFDRAPLGYQSLDADGHFLDVNEAWLQTLGYDRGEVIGKWFGDFLAPEYRARFGERFPLFKAAGTVHSEFEMLHKSGRRRYIVFEGRIGHHKDGSFERTHCILRDDTEQHRAEEELRRTASEWQTTFDASNDAIFILDTEHRVLRSNRMAERLFHRPGSEMLGEHCWAIVHGTTGPHPDCPLVRAQKSLQRESMELAEGARWFEVVVDPILDADRRSVGAVHVVSDITARKGVEEQFARLSRSHELILSAAAEGILGLDERGNHTFVNPAAARMLGAAAADLLGRPSHSVWHHTRVDGSAYPEEECEIHAAGQDGVEHHCSTEVFWRKDGTSFPVEYTSTPIREQGRLTGTVVTFVDITERLRSGEEKAQLEDQLRQAQKVEAIGRLAGGVAHDFNNLTAIVLGYGEMLLGQVHAEDPKRKYVQQIVEAGRRSAALTRQLLAFSRKQTLQTEVLDLNALLRNLEQMLGRVIGENISLKLRLGAAPGRIKADPGQIEQVVTNLVLNARDAMPLGGALTIETADFEIEETFVLSHRGASPGRYVLLTLADNGNGMDQETLNRLFEPFFTTKPKGKGTGLGLATVYGIVKQSGGYIWVESEPDTGTRFSMYLPRTDEELAVKPAAAGEAVPRGGGELILLVEDQAPLRGLCETVLSQLGYRVIAAANGREALNLVREGPLEPDLVLTDVIMPDMSGDEMVERLRRNRPEIRVLFMSGYTDDAIAAHGVLEPGTPFIEKPFTERVLATKVREALGGRTAGEAAAAPSGLSVLMIDDDEQFRELVRHFCKKQGCTFAGVDSAAAAVAALAGQPCDVLLVDLNIPGTSGERVLREIRAAGCRAPAIVLTGDISSANMEVLRPLGTVRALEKSSDGGPLLQAIKAAAGTAAGAGSNEEKG